jgi:signal transduction histidine kinase
VDETIDEVRAIAHGIYPSVLSDRGLVEALRAAARSAPVSCTVQDDGIGRHSEEIESAVYFACVGAVANVGREATRIAITLRADERLRFEVRADDAGSARPDPGQRWLDEPLDRLAAVAGELKVEAVPGEGTRVTGSVPLR